MVIALPFSQLFERYNGMMMMPQAPDALKEAIAAAPVEAQNPDDVVTEAPPPQLKIVASR